MIQGAKANIAVKANVWCNPLERDPGAIPYCLQEILPGDLLIEFLGTLDVRTLDQEMTPEQQREFQQSRFFQRHGQEGEAGTQRAVTQCQKRKSRK